MRHYETKKGRQYTYNKFTAKGSTRASVTRFFRKNCVKRQKNCVKYVISQKSHFFLVLDQKTALLGTLNPTQVKNLSLFFYVFSTFQAKIFSNFQIPKLRQKIQLDALRQMFKTERHGVPKIRQMTQLRQIWSHCPLPKCAHTNSHSLKDLIRLLLFFCWDEGNESNDSRRKIIFL